MRKSEAVTRSTIALMVLFVTVFVFTAALSFPIHDVKAASMKFTSDTRITAHTTINAGEIWTINPGVKLTIDYYALEIGNGLPETL